MVTKTVFIYSGQGSHYYHMGKALYVGNACFKRHVDRLNSLVERKLGHRPMDAVYDVSKAVHDRFDTPSVTSLAIFIVERALSLALAEQGVIPDVVVGSSMGSFAASVQAGVFDEEDAIELLHHQVSTVTDIAPQGGMTAIIDSPEIFHRDEMLKENAEISAVNFDSHFVISYGGEKASRVLHHLKTLGVTHQELAVSIPYHSSLLDCARESYLDKFDCYAFNLPEIEFVCCAHKGKLDRLTSQVFWDIVREPIHFYETIAHNFLVTTPALMIDVGPSGTMATFLKYIFKGKEGHKIEHILTPFLKEAPDLSILKRG